MKEILNLVKEKLKQKNMDPEELSLAEILARAEGSQANTALISIYMILMANKG